MVPAKDSGRTAAPVRVQTYLRCELCTIHQWLA